MSHHDRQQNFDSLYVEDLIKASKWERRFGSCAFSGGNTMKDPMHSILKEHKEKLEKEREDVSELHNEGQRQDNNC